MPGNAAAAKRALVQSADYPAVNISIEHQPPRAFQVVGEMRPTMPKSMNPTRPSGSTSRLPACTSAWKVGQPRTLANLRQTGQQLSADKDDFVTTMLSYP